MSKNKPLRKIAADNLTRLMGRHPELNTLMSVGKESHVGPSSIDRMKKGEVAVTLDTLESVAQAFKLQPWELLIDEGGRPSVSQEAMGVAVAFDRLNDDQKKFVLGLIESYVGRPLPGTVHKIAKNVTMVEPPPFHSDLIKQQVEQQVQEVFGAIEKAKHNVKKHVLKETEKQKPPAKQAAKK